VENVTQVGCSHRLGNEEDNTVEGRAKEIELSRGRPGEGRWHGDGTGGVGTGNAGARVVLKRIGLYEAGTGEKGAEERQTVNLLEPRKMESPGEGR